MSNKVAAGGIVPLIAVGSSERGPQGQQIGTIAIAPRDIDAIVRKAYGAIYKSNAKDQKH